MTAPNAPILIAPVGSIVIDLGITQRFSWTFSDPDPGDTQSKYDLRYRIVGAGSWTDTTETTPNNYRDFAGSTFTAANFEWQARTYDALGTVGPYSASEFFTAAVAPSTPTITAPTVGATVSNSATLSWSAPSQTHYQARRVGDNAGTPDTGTIYYDTGEIASVALRTLTVAFETNNRYEHVQVRVKNAGLWSSWATARVFVSYTSVAPGTVTLAADSTTASLEVTTVAGAVVGGAPTPVSIDIYVRDTSIRGYGQRMAKALVPGGVWRWWTPASGIEYAVRSLTLGSNGSTSWSVLIPTLIYDGGSPTSIPTKILDGGSPTSIPTKILDGGLP